MTFIDPQITSNHKFGPKMTFCPNTTYIAQFFESITIEPADRWFSDES